MAGGRFTAFLYAWVFSVFSFNFSAEIINAGYTSWIICCLVYLRYRKAYILQGVRIPHRPKLQPCVSYICIVVFISLLLCNGVAVFFLGPRLRATS